MKLNKIKSEFCKRKKILMQEAEKIFHYPHLAKYNSCEQIAN